MFRAKCVMLIAAGFLLAACSRKKEVEPSKADQPSATSPAGPSAEPATAEELSPPSSPGKVAATDDAATRSQAKTPPAFASDSAVDEAETSPATTTVPEPAAAGEKQEEADFQPPELLEYYPPFYPLTLRMEGIEGRVDLDLTIDAEGRVANVEVAQVTAPQFRDFAVTAARAWRFVPAHREGKPVQSKVRFPVSFLSEYGSLGMSANSPLAGLVYLDGKYYSVSPEGNYSLANRGVTPLVQVIPPYDSSVQEGGLRAVLSFTVNEEGRVVDPSVLEASPKEFGDNALRAIRFWQFVPEIRDGIAVARQHVQQPVKISPGEKSPPPPRIPESDSAAPAGSAQPAPQNG